MGVKRLQSVGFISDSSPGAAFAPLIDTGDVFEKPALIVYQGDHESMDGIVPVTEYHIDLLIARHNSHISKIKQLVGSDEIPIRHYPPLQVDHSTSSHDTVGRIVGELSKGTHQLVDGRIVPAVYGRVRVLGRENTEKARDGRWAEVSVGADFDEGILSELSFTPFPAATDASLLSKFAQGETMITKLQAYLMKTAKLSEKDAEDKLSKMSLNEKAKLSGAMEEEDKKEKLLLSNCLSYLFSMPIILYGSAIICKKTSVLHKPKLITGKNIYKKHLPYSTSRLIIPALPLKAIVEHIVLLHFPKSYLIKLKL